MKLVAFLLLSAIGFAKDPGLDRVTQESSKLRASSPQTNDQIWKAIRAFHERSPPLHQALRDWVESRLPQSLEQLATIPAIDRAITRDLAALGFREETGDRNEVRSGVPLAHVQRLREDSNKVLVTADVTVPCGTYSLAYLYDYATGSRQRILEDRPRLEHEEAVREVRVSAPGSQGGQLIVVFRSGVQCGSSWNSLSYHVAAWSPRASEARPVFADEHDIWFGAEHPYQARLSADDVLLELRSWSIDLGIHNRAHILHYRLADGIFSRVDPVALGPQDFVEEWLSRPWSEMSTRSSAAAKLGHLHQILVSAHPLAHIQVVQRCPQTSLWQIGIALSKKRDEETEVWFLVQSRPGYHYLMKSVSLDRQPGCPGDTPPSSDEAQPTLFPRAKK